LAFAVLLLSDKQKTRFDVFSLWLLLVISLSTGSRGVLLAIALAFLFKYGFSNRNLIYAFVSLICYFMLIDIPLDTSLNRFASQNLLNDRLLQYQYAYETILQKPFFGFGLDKYAYINTEVIPYYLRSRLISAHNGYLAILTQYGLIFGFIILFVIFKKSIQMANYFRKSLEIERIYLFIIVYALFASVYETLLTGINEFHTILFWFSLTFLSYLNYTREYES
jgi:O-antigen ligase